MDLREGGPAPVQQSRITCGATALTVARALVDPALDHWLATGADPPGSGMLPTSPTAQARLAAHERIVHRRTTSLVGPAGRVQPPWPRLLGTPPWGARAELESGAASQGMRYRIRVLRSLSPARLAAAHEALRYAVRPGAPAALYVGSAWLPRHVALVVAGDAHLLAYDPDTAAWPSSSRPTWPRTACTSAGGTCRGSSSCRWPSLGPIRRGPAARPAPARRRRRHTTAR